MTPSPDVLVRRSRAMALRRRVRSYDPWRRNAELVTFGMLVVGLTAVALVMLGWPSLLPPVSSFAPFVVLAGLFLSPRLTGAFYVYLLGWLTTVILQRRLALSDIVVSVAGQIVIMAFMLWISRSRSRLGVTGVRGEAMLVDLRDRLRRGGELPALPTGWYAESAVDSAHGNSFSGDFLLTSRSADGNLFEIVLVDVSGKGGRAGTRALLLSGAFGGLLGSMRPDEFLPAANGYLLRQQWDEGFATCVHVAIDLTTGRFTVGSAGHPPGAQYLAGSGRWSLVGGPSGPLLGVIAGAVFPRVEAVMSEGDALLFYTDGVIESRHTELEDGIDRMLGVAERVGAKGFTGLARAVCNSARSGDSDDRAAVVVVRR